MQRRQILTELEIARRLSRTAAAGRNLDEIIDSAVDLATRLPGVTGITLGWDRSVRDDVTFGSAGGSALETGTAPIAASGIRFGSITLEFDPARGDAQSISRLCGFLGEQIGVTAVLEHFENRGKLLATEIQHLHDHLATRKIFERARGIVASKRGISEATAANLIKEHARRARQPIRELSEALILADRPAFADSRPHFERRTA